MMTKRGFVSIFIVVVLCFAVVSVSFAESQTVQAAEENAVETSDGPVGTPEKAGASPEPSSNGTGTETGDNATAGGTSDARQGDVTTTPDIAESASTDRPGATPDGTVTGPADAAASAPQAGEIGIQAVDITNDLLIDVTQLGVKTPTKTDTYDTGMPAGTYVPGKDYSATDDVSGGTQVRYTISVALSSQVSQETYSLDSLYVVCADDAQGGANTPVYRINADTDPENITDNGQYAVFSPNAGYYATMSQISFDGSNTSIVSGSTLEFDVTFTLPGLLYWKTKIAPKIKIIATKDGQTVESAPFALSDVRMTSKGGINSKLDANTNNGWVYATRNGQTGFWMTAQMEYSYSTKQNMAFQGDTPLMNNITYSAVLAPTLNGAPVTGLTAGNISLNVSGGTLGAYTYENNILAVTYSPNSYQANSTVYVQLYIPFTVTTETSATLGLQGSWNTGQGGTGVTFGSFTNGYLFDQTVTGGFQGSKVISFVEEPTTPVTPTLQDTISMNIASNGTLTQQLYMTNIPFVTDTAGLKITALLDSGLAYFDNTPGTLQLSYYAPGAASAQHVTISDFSLQYATVDLSGSYDPEGICHAANTGGLALQSYDAGSRPNLRVLTIGGNALAGVSVDPEKQITISYISEKLVVDSASDFVQIFQSNPQSTYTSVAYNYMSIPTNYASVADANATFAGSLNMGAGDAFAAGGSGVMLHIGTLKSGNTADRFNLTSTVRTTSSVGPFQHTFQLALCNASYTPVSTVTNYSSQYYLVFRGASSSSNGLGYALFHQGATLRFDIPAALRANIYPSGMPQMVGALGADSGAGTDAATITQYGYDGAAIYVTLPKDLLIVSNSNYIAIPIEIIPPNSDTQFTPNVSGYPNNGIFLYGAFAVSMIRGVPANLPGASPFFSLATTPRTTTLSGLGSDVSIHGRTAPTYANGSTDTFFSMVTNSSYSPAADYLVAMAVPTNEYNMNKGSSDNSLEGYIRGITLYDSVTEVYYQTASNATPSDITAVSTVADPGDANLSDYFTGVITAPGSTWVKHVPGTALPADVVMLVAYHPGLAQHERIRVDYDVLMMVDPIDKNTYTNDSQMKYYTSGAGMEVGSNVARIQNIPFGTDFNLVKSTTPNVKYKVQGETIPYTLQFTIPETAGLFDSMQVVDQLPAGLALDESTLSLVAIEIGATPDAAYTHTYANGWLVMDITDFKNLAGHTLKASFTAVLEDPSAVPEDDILRNTFSIQFDNNPDYGGTSNEVDVPLLSLPGVQPPVKTATQESVPKEVGSVINYKVVSLVPDDVNHHTESVITLTDPVPAGLTVTGTHLKIYMTNNYEAPIDLYEQAGYLTITNQSSGNTVRYEIAFTLPASYIDTGAPFGLVSIELQVDTEISNPALLGRTVSNTAAMEVSRRNGPIPSNEVDVALVGEGEGTVTVRFINRDTNLPLTDSVVLTGDDGQAYDAAAVRAGKSFPGFRYVEMSGDPEQGTFDKDAPKEVIYYYEPDPVVRASGSVTIQFLEKTTNQPLADPVTLTDGDGTPYDTNGTFRSKSFAGYRYVSRGGDPEQGLFAANTPKTVTYYYEKIVAATDLEVGTLEIRFVEKATGFALAENETRTGVSGASYDTAPIKAAKNFPGYVFVEVTGDPEQGVFEAGAPKEVLYYYEKLALAPDTGAVVVRFVDQITGLALAEDEVLTGEAGASYDTVPVKEAKSFPGYIYVTVTGDPEQGVFVADTTKEVVYYYTRLNTDLAVSSQGGSSASGFIQTGDSSGMLLYVLLIGIAGAAIAAAVLYRTWNKKGARR